MKWRESVIVRWYCRHCGRRARGRKMRCKCGGRIWETEFKIREAK